MRSSTDEIVTFELPRYLAIPIMPADTEHDEVCWTWDLARTDQPAMIRVLIESVGNKVRDAGGAADLSWGERRDKREEYAEAHIPDGIFTGGGGKRADLVLENLRLRAMNRGLPKGKASKATYQQLDRFFKMNDIDPAAEIEAVCKMLVSMGVTVKGYENDGGAE